MLALGQTAAASTDATVRSAPKVPRITVSTSFVAVSPIRFASGSFEIPKSSLAMLDRTAEAIRAYGHQRFVVAGHSDSIGTRDQNTALSLRRARAVADYLIARGVPATRLRVVARGASAPVADNRTARGRSLNRRVVLLVD
jgi:outer membrane protein OmpA-like peptidoglycan-associated protein